jgi:hypothetical protein
MQLDPSDFDEPGWKILKEKLWYSAVIVDSATDPQHAPRSFMATRQLGTDADALEGIWIHIIPLPSRPQAEALSVTLLQRIRPNPDSEVSAGTDRQLDGVCLAGASSVRAVEKETVGMGMTGRELIIVAAVDTVAFGVGYGCLGDGWTQERFVDVAQLQADKIRRQMAAP